MASSQQIRETLTLEEFLERPEIDEHPYQEFIDGKIEVKMSPQGKHGRIALRLATHLDQFAVANRLGVVFVEVRFTFAGRSILPDIAFLLKEHIEVDALGEIPDVITRPPDFHIEIVSPRQSVKKQRAKLQHSTAHGCLLGTLIDPRKKTVEVFLPGQHPRLIESPAVLEGEPVMPGLRLPVEEIFRWLKLDV